jgi:hypothetical protein
VSLRVLQTDVRSHFLECSSFAGGTSLWRFDSGIGQRRASFTPTRLKVTARSVALGFLGPS